MAYKWHEKPPQQKDSMMTKKELREWMQNNTVDGSCDVLKMHPRDLLPIVSDRCARRRKKMRLPQSRECDPCICGSLQFVHSECFWWFAETMGNEKPSNHESALKWRIKMSNHENAK